MRTYALRLKPNSDLRKSLEDFVADENIKAGCILTCVGCVNKAVIRMAGAECVNEYVGKFEIVSLVGTIEKGDSHLHIAISNEKGEVLGGHLKVGTLVDTTAEVIIGEIENVSFSRKYDDNTGYDELVIESN